jgi:hypothetical protein
MQGANKERWKVLCEQAATEQEVKEARLKGNPPKT